MLIEMKMLIIMISKLNDAPLYYYVFSLIVRNVGILQIFLLELPMHSILFIVPKQYMFSQIRKVYMVHDGVTILL